MTEEHTPDLSDGVGDTSAEFERRRGEVEEMRARGIDPYPVRFDRDRTAASLREEFGDLEPGTETGVTVRVAGRLLLIRRQGKLAFATMRVGVARSPNRFGPLRQRAPRCPLCSKTRYSRESVFDPNGDSMRSGVGAVLVRILL